MNTPRRWQFWIDRGGTFTDVVGRAPDGALHDVTTLLMLLLYDLPFREHAAVRGRGERTRKAGAARAVGAKRITACA